MDAILHGVLEDFSVNKGLGHDRLGESRASVLRVSVIVWSNPIESGVGVLGVESDQSGPHTGSGWSGNGLCRFWTAFLESFVRYAYILRTTALFCSIGPALLGPHRLLALNPDSPIDDTPSKPFFFRSFIIFFHLSHTFLDFQVTRNIEIKTCGLRE